MGKRFLAILAAVALGAGSALVGLSMASGTWNVVGVGLAPGEGYALQLKGSADRIKLELANATTEPLASLSVYAPSGQRAGFYQLDGTTRSVEVVAAQGVWLVFVYKAQGGDLTLSFHGGAEAGRMLPAEVERQEMVLGHQRQLTEEFTGTFTAIVDREPVLANVYLKGSARGFQSELRSEKGVVEVINEQEVSQAATGMIVDARGERVTLPQNLASGPFTAEVQAQSLSGTLMLVTLYLRAPVFEEPLPDEAPEAEPEPAPEPGKPHKPPSAEHPKKPPRQHPRPPPPQPPEEPQDDGFTDCGVLEARHAMALAVDMPLDLRLTLGEARDPWVTVFDPRDEVLDVVQLEEEGDEALVHLPDAGEYVLYARGFGVQAALEGVEECELRVLGMETVTLATFHGELLGGVDEKAESSLGLAPLEFGLRLSPDGAAFQVEAVFTGPEGEAARAHQGLEVGLLGSMPGPSEWFGGSRGSERGAEVDASKMVAGDWLVELRAEALQGDLEAFALVYVRDAADEDDGR